MMDKGQFETSQELLIAALERFSGNHNAYDAYYLQSYLAEVMYYTALNEQGLQNAGEALKIAATVQNDTLKGNAYNLLGLIHLNAQRYDSALFYLNNALLKIPENLNKPRLSRYDQVLGNLAETYLRIKNPQQALAFGHKAMAASQKIHAERAIILNHWTLAEAFLQTMQLDSTLWHILAGFNNGQIEKYPDARLYLLSTAIKASAATGNTSNMQASIDEGILLSDKLGDYDYAVSQFYGEAVNALLSISDFRQASIIQQRLNALQERSRMSRESMHMRLLNAYYRNEQALAIEMATKQQHEQEIRLNRKVQIILGALIAALILLFIFFRRWIGQRRKLERLTFEQDKKDTLRKQELESLRSQFNAIEEERNRIARELHDDIGSSISSASIFADLAIQVIRNDQEKARVLMIRAKAKTQEISENISDLIWAIYSRNDSWLSLIERIRNFCFEILSSKEIEVKIQDDKQLHDVQIPIQYKKSLLLFLKEAVNNIAKYSQATEVSIRIELENEMITLQIDDNGVGFDTSLSTKGNGLLNFQAHAKSVKGSVKIVSSPGQGTHIRLTFPSNFKGIGI